MRGRGDRIVHLELETANLGRACAFYRELFAWEPETLVHSDRRYQALRMGGEIGGGVVEDERAEPAVWLPYVEVEDVVEATVRARALGAVVVLGPREGPAGWRSIVYSASSGRVALWQSKRLVAPPPP